MGALEPIEESDVIGVLATWQQTRTATAQKKLNRNTRTIVDHEGRSETRSREVGGSHSVLQLSRRWSFQLKLSKETRANTWK